MAHEAAPAYQWYVKEWRSSRAVQRMTFAQRGMYREMLDEQWERFSLPDCPHACADLLGGTDVEWVENWPVLRRKFVDRRAKPRKEHEAIVIPVDYDPSRRIINVRLEKQRRERHSYKKEKSVAGQKGGEARARNIRARNTLPAVADVAVLQTAVADPSIGLAKRSSSSSSSSASSSSSSTASATAVKDRPPKEPADPRIRQFIEWFVIEYKTRRNGADYLVVWERDSPIVKRLLKTTTYDRLQNLARILLSDKTEDEFIQRTDRSIGILSRTFNWLSDRLAQFEARQKTGAA